MNTARRVALWAVPAALLGCAAGYLLGRALTDDVQKIDLLTAVQSRYSSYALGVRGAVNRDAHEDDLRSYLAYLDARARKEGGSGSSLFAFDKAITLTRLAQIEKSRGNASAADETMRQATAACASTGLRNCTSDLLSSVAREHDRVAWDVPRDNGRRR